MCYKKGTKKLLRQKMDDEKRESQKKWEKGVKKVLKHDKAT